MAMKKRSTVMGGIKEYLEQCPAINTYVETLGREVNVNYLDEPEKSYSISQEPNEPWVKKYVDGPGTANLLKQINFYILGGCLVAG